MREASVTLLVILGLCAAGCSSAPPATTTTAVSATTTVHGQPAAPRQLLTPIPGVSTVQRISAAKKCSDGMIAGSASAAVIAKATDETVTGQDAVAKMLAAQQALQQAKAAGVGQSVLDACTESLGYVEQARKIRAGQVP